MVSSIEIASSSPLGGVLKDHNNRRERRNTNHSPNKKSQSNFQRNLKELVRDHLHSCISISPKGSNTKLNKNSDHSDETGTSTCWGRGKWSYQSTIGKKNSSNIWDVDLRVKETRITTTMNQKQQNQEAEVMALSSIPSSASSSIRETSPTLSDNDFSVSSLVQKWREAEAQNTPSSNSNNVGTTQPQNTIPCPSSLNVCEEPSREKENSEVRMPTIESTIDERQENTLNYSTSGECQMGGISTSSSDGMERKRMRVADIVRKWAQTSHGAAACDEWHNQQQQQQQNANPFGSGLTQLRIRLDQRGGEQRGGIFAGSMVCSPKIRGRQAIADLFMRMEKERYKEVEFLATRQAVSKFPQRRRIQSLLKLRILRREVFQQDKQPLLSQPAHKNDQQRPPLPKLAKKHDQRRLSMSPPVESISMETVNVVVNQREKCTTAIDQSSTNVASDQKGITKINQETEKTSTSKQSYEQTISQNSEGNLNKKKRLTFKSNNQLQQARDLNVAIENINNNVNVEMSIYESEQQVQSSSDLEEKSTIPQLQVSEEESPQQNLVGQVIEQLHDEISSQELSQNNNYEGAVNFEMQDTAIMSYSNWEEEEFIAEGKGASEEFFESSLDWIVDIARPRSFWEDRRQAWYQEVFNTRSQDEEIRQLLERGSVSTVLASDFRDRMDRLVICSVQRAMHSNMSEEQEGDQSMGALLDQCVLSFNLNNPEGEPQQEHAEDTTQEYREGAEEQNEVEDVEEDNINQYDDPTTPSLIQFSRDHYQCHEASNVSDDAPSTSMQQSSPLPSFDCGTYGDSPFKSSSIEMELIYDLRVHMEQLYQEMSEIRKSITSCVEMQLKMQQSMKEEVSVVNNLKKRGKVKDSNKRRPKNGNCCICCEKKVDSLLYRCGHMCTCFNCAYELQWSSGKCPICRAQIIDVVRAYPDN